MKVYQLSTPQTIPHQKSHLSVSTREDFIKFIIVLVPGDFRGKLLSKIKFIHLSKAAQAG